MSVWLTIPSKRANGGTIAKWRERGYNVAVFLDHKDPEIAADYLLQGRYDGYAKAVNALVKWVLAEDSEAEWFINAGDDMLPDANILPQEIANQCADHFAIVGGSGKCRTFGVMQPTGDRYGENPRHPDQAMRGAYADRVAGSAWIGREFAKRVNLGNGPLWPEYFHAGEDEELQHVAIKYGAFWQRPDLIQLHQHWARERGMAEDMPDFLARANSPREWQAYKRIFEARKTAGFPGCELIP